MTGEHVILLDEQDKPVGRLEKYAAHTLNTPLHLAFSCWLFNDHGQLLVTRRSLGKKAWPGVWTNSVCGHPQSGETFEQAVTRRSRFELGVNIANIASVHPAFRYRAVAPQRDLSKTKSARFTPHALSARYRLIATRSWTISGVSWRIYCRRWRSHRGPTVRGWCSKRLMIMPGSR